MGSYQIQNCCINRGTSCIGCGGCYPNEYEYADAISITAAEAVCLIQEAIDILEHGKRTDISENLKVLAAWIELGKSWSMELTEQHVLSARDDV